VISQCEITIQAIQSSPFLGYILQPSNINLPKYNSPQWLQKGCVSSILAVNSICAGELLEEADILV